MLPSELLKGRPSCSHSSGFRVGITALYSAGKKAGQSAVQEAWDKDKAQIQAVADQAIATATKAKEDALANNEQVTNDLQKQIDAARTLNTGLAQRLRLATSNATSVGTLFQADSDANAVTAAYNARLGQITDAVAATLTECAANRANQIALQKEIAPQL